MAKRDTLQEVREKTRVRVPVSIALLMVSFVCFAAGMFGFISLVSKSKTSVIAKRINTDVIPVKPAAVSKVIVFKLSGNANAQQVITSIPQRVDTSVQVPSPTLRHEKNTPAMTRGVNPNTKLNSPSLAHAQHGLKQWYQVTLDSRTDVTAFLQNLKKTPGVVSATVSATMHVTSLPPSSVNKLGRAVEASTCTNPNDPFSCSTGAWGNTYPDLWGLQRIQAPAAWAETKGSDDVVVAVVDTGIDLTHPDLQGSLWTNTKEIPGNGIDDDGNGYIDDVQGWNFVANSNDPTDDFGHGTHVAGTVGAATDNSIGIAGVNWHVKLMAVKGIDASGSGTDYDLANAITYAVDNGANIINMSWGGQGTSPVLTDAFAYAAAKGVTLVASAGNDNRDTKYYLPANDPHVIAVGAWGPDDARASFSNFGAKLDVMAPGVDILSLRAGETDMYCYENSYYCDPENSHLVSDQAGQSIYYRSSGTSMAAPHVAGVVALMKAVAPAASPELIRLALQQSADDVLAVGRDDQSGYGVLNAAGAVSSIQSFLTNKKPELLINNPHATYISTSDKVTVSATIVNAGLVATQSPTGVVIYRGSASTANVLSKTTVAALSAGGSATMSISISRASLNGQPVVLMVNSPDGGVAVQDEYFTGNDTWSSTISYYLSGWPKVTDTVFPGQPTIADVDGDGRADIVVGLEDGNLEIFHDNGTPLAGWPQHIAPYLDFGMFDQPAIVTDINGDGKPEVIAQDDMSPTLLYIWDSTGHLLPGWPRHLPLVNNQQGNILSVAVADVDHDGKPELVLTGDLWDEQANTTVGVVTVMRLDGSVLPGWPQTAPGMAFHTLPVDINGDGKMEIFATIAYEDTVGDYSVLSADLFGYSSTGAQLAGWPESVGDYNYREAPTLADLNHDGKPEIIFGGAKFNPDTGLDTATIFAYSANGTPVPGWPITSTRPNEIQFRSVAADMNRDGAPEVVSLAQDVDPTTYAVTSRVYVHKANGTVMSGFPIFVPEQLSSPAIGDLDGDGYPEILGTGMNGQLYAWKINGQQLPGWPQSTGETELGSPVIADLNHDLHPEIVSVSGFGQGTVFVWVVPGSSSRDCQAWPYPYHDYADTKLYTWKQCQAYSGGGKMPSLIPD